MNVITEVGKKDAEGQAKPSMAFVFYQHGMYSHQSALVRHHINEAGEFGVGELLSAEVALSDIEHALRQTAPEQQKVKHSSMLLPEHLLMDNGRSLVWHVPRREAPLWFKHNKTERLRIEWPAMIVAVNKSTRSLSMFAVGTNRRPSASTRVYKLPMFNIYGTGVVCQGTATIPKTLTRDSREAVLDSFINAFKTHTNDKDLLRPATLKKLDATSSNSKALWRYWVQKAGNDNQPPERVRMSELTPVGCLQDVLMQLA